MVNKFILNNSKTNETKESISRNLEIVNDYAGELTIEVLSLDKVELDPDNNRILSLTLEDAMKGIDPSDPLYLRKKQDWKSLESLSKTIAEDQLINPIFVYRYGNKCRLIAGERRTLASAIAGKKEIIARIAGKRPVGTKLKVLQWIENNERVDLSLAERVSSVSAIIQEYLKENKNKQEKITAKVLSELTGMSPTQSRRYILITEASEQIKEAIAEGKIENIKLLEIILSTDNKEHQSILLNAAIANMTIDQINKLKSEIELKEKNISPKRGRTQTNVSLGRVKPNIAKILLDALVKSSLLNGNIINQLESICKGVQWANGKSVETSFKKVLALLAQEM